MSESLWVDIDELRASSAELNRVVARTARMAAELEAELTVRGEFWGDDEPGKLFAESYVPGVEQAMAGMAGLVAELRSAEIGFADAADAYGESDIAGANRIATTSSPAATGDFGVSDPAAYRSPGFRAAPEYNLPAAGYRPHTDEAALRNDAGPISDGQTRTPGAPYSPALPAQRSRPETASPESSEPAGPAGRGRYRGSNGEPDALGTPTDRVDAATTIAPPPRGTPAVIAPASNTTTAKPADGPRAKQLPAGQLGPAGRAAGVSAPGNSGNSPWSKSPPAPSSATAPQGGTPPRTYPPRPSAPRTKDDKQVAGKPARDVPLVRRPQTSDVEVMRIAREMAARHNLELRGFEATELHQHTVRQIEAALDQVLGRFTLPLCGIEITRLAGVPSRTEDRSTATDSSAPALWVVLDTEAAANPAPPPGPDAASPQSTEAGRQESPLYATVLRALGSALDISGGCRARAEAQRALITEYLRVNGSKGDTLARVVGGYRKWRAGLSGNSFEHGVFAPEQALADAFAAVESDAEAARPPQKVLHRLLITLARTSGTSR
ncbi:hypothetical protein AB0H42_31420 [Nocardia sp. NPDC050799]|uniref:hypothetical protein n=1 Tax=Nocardia sp. NPDC050799 TaxID=3154842 RepID=UPI0033F410F4